MDRVPDDPQLALPEAERLRAELRAEVVREIRHDLRNPLHVLVGFVDLLAMTDLPPPADEYVEHLQAATAQMRAVLEGA